MNCTTERLSYRQTGYFNKMVLDYLEQAPELKPFYEYPLDDDGLGEMLERREFFPTSRVLIAEQLLNQYDLVPWHETAQFNIRELLDRRTFTVTTAHQNNIFTGPLYFIYKILHTIKLARHFKYLRPGLTFVPVFYIGSEDADLAELNHIHLNGHRLEWKTQQSGAVGRMKIDKDLLRLVDEMEGQLLGFPFGAEIINKIRQYYTEGETIQMATFRFVHDLFAEYGLLVLMPDNLEYKSTMEKIFTDDLFHQTPSSIVEQTNQRLDAAGYKVQAHPRDINLFYLLDNLRERIVRKDDHFEVLNTDIQITRDEVIKQLEERPDFFSPNVILRGLYQEILLPNVAFVGGGGELAYWLQLKDLFAHYEVPFPMLVLRNSFLVVEKKWQDRIAKTGFTVTDFFLPTEELVNRLVKKEAQKKLELLDEVEKMKALYQSIKEKAGAVDRTLEQHVESLQQKTLYRLQELEKKMLRAEKRKYADQRRQIETIKAHLFPKGGLQERYENFAYYYALWGKSFIEQLLNHSPELEGEFVVLKEN